MRKSIIFLISVATSISIVDAQDLRGGFGHTFFGVGYNISPKIQSDLQVPSILGSELQLSSFSAFVGGGGYGLLGRRILIGGSGFGYRISDATARGMATVSVGSGLANIGYLIFLKENIISFPYFGIGPNGMKLKLENNTIDESFDLGKRIIAPGTFVNLNSGGMSFELGYALKFLTFSVIEAGGNGGFMVGVQAGTYFFIGMEDWNEESANLHISKFSRPYAFSPYIRITIGGGGFKNISGE